MIKYGFFDAKMDDYGEPDRVYSSDDVNSFFDGILTDGIFSGYMNAFHVSAEGMRVSIDSGKALVSGHWMTSNETEYIDISQAHPVKDRYTKIVIRYDKSNRTIELAAIDGTEDAHPVSPSITQTDDIYEIALADVLIRASSSSIDPADITDLREYAYVLPAAAKVNYRRHETTAKKTIKEMLIPEAYRYNIDTNLQVYVNGLLLRMDEYNVTLANTSSGYKIVFANKLAAGADISIVMIS
jgi:hypothetical protein